MIALLIASNCTPLIAPLIGRPCSNPCTLQYPIASNCVRLRPTALIAAHLLLTNAETRDFSRKMGSAFMLLPHERVWGNTTILSLHGGDAPLIGASTLPRYGGRAATGADGAASLFGAEYYRGNPQLHASAHHGALSPQVLSTIEAHARICVVSYEKSRRKTIASDG